MIPMAIVFLRRSTLTAVLRRVELSTVAPHSGESRRVSVWRTTGDPLVWSPSGHARGPRGPFETASGDARYQSSERSAALAGADDCASWNFQPIGRPCL